MAENKINRREFLSKSAALGVAGVVGTSMLLSCDSKNKQTPLRPEGSYYVPELADAADEGRELKVGIIGCGGRGTGAVLNLLDAAKGVTITAAGDVIEEHMKNFRAKMKEARGFEIPDDHCFIGFDAYKKVIDSGVDAVICTTAPVFRPTHFAYAVEKGVHCFLEKPVAVDPVGCRKILATAKQAEAKGLSVVTGTQRHHQRPYVEAFQKIQEGMIGEITGGNVYWNGGMLWYKDRKPEWNDMEYMIRDWVNWKWLSGDHIVEQHVHNIDVFMWMSGLKPVRATGVGARHRRITGDQFDCFNIDFEFENGIHVGSMCRQIDGCSSNVSEFIQGTKGSWNSIDHEIKDLQGNVIWKFDSAAAEANFKVQDPYILEHVDWINHIRRGEAHDEATGTAYSTMAGVVGRQAAYTGLTVDFEEMMASDMNYLPENCEMGPVDMSGYTVAVPGTGK